MIATRKVNAPRPLEALPLARGAPWRGQGRQIALGVQAVRQFASRVKLRDKPRTDGSEFAEIAQDVEMQ